MQPIPDTLLFFASQTPVSIPPFSLLDKNKECYNVMAKPLQCPSKQMKFSSTQWWESRTGHLVSTAGLIFVEINSLKFPVSLVPEKAVNFFSDFRSVADLSIMEQPSSATCTQTELSESELQVRNACIDFTFVPRSRKKRSIHWRPVYSSSINDCSRHPSAFYVLSNLIDLFVKIFSKFTNPLYNC